MRSDTISGYTVSDMNGIKGHSADVCCYSTLAWLVKKTHTCLVSETCCQNIVEETESEFEFVFLLYLSGSHQAL